MARINVYVPDALLKTIDHAAQQANLQRSAWLQWAAKVGVNQAKSEAAFCELERSVASMEREVRKMKGAASSGARVVAFTRLAAQQRRTPKRNARRP